MKKRTPTNMIVIGDRIEDVYCLKSINKAKDGYHVILSDKEGEVEASLSDVRYDEGIRDSIGGPVFVSGPVIDGLNSKALVVIKEIRKAQEKEYRASDIFNGLTDDEIRKYKDCIRSMQAKITDAECSALVSACLSDKVIELLAEKPATVGYHGVYRGGALAACAIVSKMVYANIAYYQTLAPGMYNARINLSALLCASLLHTYGTLTYISNREPWVKTVAGLNRGYIGVLQSLIERTVAKQGVEISEDKLSVVLNILGCACSMKTSVKATGPEGAIFRKVLMAYEELDAIFASTAEKKPEEGEDYYFDKRLGRTLVFPSEERSA